MAKMTILELAKAFKMDPSAELDKLNELARFLEHFDSIKELEDDEGPPWIAGRSPDWPAKLKKAVRHSKMPVYYVDDVRQTAHAQATIAVLKAFGDAQHGFVYIEPCARGGIGKPPDILLAHPSLGILVVEVKDWPIEEIHAIANDEIVVLENGVENSRNVFFQAGDVMSQFKAAVRHSLRQEFGTVDDKLIPLFNFMVAFPMIQESEWFRCGYKDRLDADHILFSEHLQDPRRLLQRVAQMLSSNNRRNIRLDFLTREQLTFIQKAIGDSAVINENRKVRPEISGSVIGHEIDDFLGRNNGLSEEQQELSRADFEGHPQLIRGVAGSGKSVVLSNCVARFVNRKLKEKDEQGDTGRAPRVAVVCFNRSFVPFLREKIEIAFKTQSLRPIPDGIVEVVHLNGLLFSLSNHFLNPKKGPLQYQPIPDKMTSEDEARIARGYVTQLQSFARSEQKTLESILFDAIYVDEGQDFRHEDFHVLLWLLRPHPRTNEKNIVIFYDDAQDVYGRPRPNWKSLDINVVGGQRSRLMKECFRNTKEIVEFAFNVLLGSQAPAESTVQMREYADVAYLESTGLVKDIQGHWEIKFAKRSYESPEVMLFQSRDQEKAWICEKIDYLVSEQKVRPEDILVIFHQSTDFLDLESMIAAKTKSVQGFVKPFGGQSKDKDSYIFRDDHLTLSTIKGAKGYDAPVVFLVGADQLKNDREGRASFYVGATRARMFLFVSGLDGTQSIAKEAYMVRQMMRGASSKVRVYELAKELSIDSKELVEKLKAARIPVKNYMSMLDEQAVIKARKVALNRITRPTAAGNEVREAATSIGDGKETAQMQASQSDARVSEKRERDAGSADVSAAASIADKRPAEVRVEKGPVNVSIGGKTFVVDGLNVVLSFPRQKSGNSFDGLLTLLIEIRRRGGDFICFFDASAPYQIEEKVGKRATRSYSELTKSLPDYFVQVPARKQADDFILPTADRNGRLIISNDEFDQYKSKFKWLKKAERCLFQGSMIRKVLEIPGLEISINVRSDTRAMVNELINHR